MRYCMAVRLIGLFALSGVTGCGLFGDDEESGPRGGAPPAHQQSTEAALASEASGTTAPAEPATVSTEATEATGATDGTGGTGASTATEASGGVPSAATDRPAAPPATDSTDPSGAPPPVVVPKPPVAGENPLVAAPPKVCSVVAPLVKSQVLPAQATAKTTPVSVTIVRPHPNQILDTGLLKVQAEVRGFRTYKTDKSSGNHLRVLLDNEAPRDWFDPDESAFVIEGIAPGLHTVRVLAVTPWGECIKQANAFDAISFYVQTIRNTADPIDHALPMLSYSEPRGTYRGVAGQRILVDFHLANTVLAADGHRVRMILDDRPPVSLQAWAPLWLVGLADGRHRIRLTLLDKDGKQAPGPYNDVDRSFEVVREF